MKVDFFMVEGSNKATVINAQTSVRKYQMDRYGKYFGETVVLEELLEKVVKDLEKQRAQIERLEELRAKVVDVIRKENEAAVNIALRLMSREEVRALLGEMGKADEAAPVA